MTFYRELIERAPIIQEDRIGQDMNDPEEYRQAWTDTFKAAKPIVWGQIFRMLGATLTQRLRNSRKAYCDISMSLFG